MYPVANVDPFRARLSRQCKARSAVNGPVLYKERNAAVAAQARSLRAARKRVIRCVVALAKGRPLPASHALRLTLFRAAEWVNIGAGVH